MAKMKYQEEKTCDKRNASTTTTNTYNNNNNYYYYVFQDIFLFSEIPTDQPSTVTLVAPSTILHNVQKSFILFSHLYFSTCIWYLPNLIRGMNAVYHDWIVVLSQSLETSFAIRNSLKSRVSLLPTYSMDSISCRTCHYSPFVSFQI
jgi:hypothetical protein